MIIWSLQSTPDTGSNRFMLQYKHKCVSSKERAGRLQPDAVVNYSTDQVWGPGRLHGYQMMTKGSWSAHHHLINYVVISGKQSFSSQDLENIYPLISGNKTCDYIMATRGFRTLNASAHILIRSDHVSSPQTPGRLRNQWEDPAELHGRSFPGSERPGRQRSLVDTKTTRRHNKRKKKTNLSDCGCKQDPDLKITSVQNLSIHSLKEKSVSYWSLISSCFYFTVLLPTNKNLWNILQWCQRKLRTTNLWNHQLVCLFVCLFWEKTDVLRCTYSAADVSHTHRCWQRSESTPMLHAKWTPVYFVARAPNESRSVTYWSLMNQAPTL